MKKFILTVFLLIFIIGCSGGSGPGRPNSYIDENYHSGTRGLEMRFITGNPPYRVYAPNGFLTDQYNIMLEVKNEGAYDISSQHFIVSGYDSNIFELEEPYFQVPDLLEGRSSNNPIGGFDTLKWTVRRTVLPEGTDRFDQRFMVSACYDYETRASIPVCVDPNPWEYTTREKICMPEHVSVGSGQGAPVSISHIEVTPMKNKVQMKVEVANNGNGRVVSLGVPLGRLDSHCPFNLGYDELDRISFGQMPDLGGIIGSCTPDEILLVNGRGAFYCTFNNVNKDGRDDAYTTTLNINLVYKYTSSVQQSIEVLTVPG